ncbi:neuroendocrine convertase 2 [Plakobranchus ocellatus]|uniref:Neuroendocrine convertase 2 n=1 Tax=Plakobranchus ocellatus TaxID=259542 RepID=A0AAV4CSN1_9GAST|nr:neuroendocrine convertase 2 [Plakobranchus ocellatus]
MLILSSNSTLAPPLCSNTTFAPLLCSNSTLAPSLCFNSTLAPSLYSNSTSAPPLCSNSTFVPPQCSNYTIAPPLYSNSTLLLSLCSNSTLPLSLCSNSTFFAPPLCSNSTFAPPLHGTRCAGEVSAAKDNHVCGVGVAWGSKVAGLRMLDQPFMTDLIEANAMGHMPNTIDIYSASWGPTDDGKTVDGPRNLTMRAIVKGVNSGRQGLGNVYVWASGDGGPNDDCNCDGYAASMWTISINSATNDGQTAGYDESCSSTLASTFSNGKSNSRDAGVATTDLYNNCTASHSGTSAAAPEAAGVFALALEANRNLTWRDMQHLTVLTSKRNSLYDSNRIHKWKLNGAHLLFNHLFGYGVLDAASMVDLASQWKGLPERFHCKAGSVTANQEFWVGSPLRMEIETDGCVGTENEVNYLEHVQAFVTLRSTYRGCVTIYLTSPMGTTSMILSQRPNDDDDKNGFNRWPFMTTHTWAEMSHGVWTLDVIMEPIMGTQINDVRGVFKEWTLVLHGTKTKPYADQHVDKNRHEKLYLVRRAHDSGVVQE